MGCPLTGIAAAEFKAAVWQRVHAVLTRREIVAAEIAKRRGSDPAVSDRTVFDRALAEVAGKQANLARTVTAVDDAGQPAAAGRAAAGVGAGPAVA